MINKAQDKVFIQIVSRIIILKRKQGVYNGYRIDIKNDDFHIEHFSLFYHTSLNINKHQVLQFYWE